MPLIYAFTVKMHMAEMRIKLITYCSGNAELCCVQNCISGQQNLKHMGFKEK